ncbi:unnamed protein product [marine sediment metagenome]|uniref:Uncharacterized protein n=1 Tax=marine sediment metagenome TaxID=412755 RepID=X0WRE5_9ZZZZ
MRKQVKKQLEKMQAVEKDRYRTACAKIRQLEIENARLKKALHASEGYVSSLNAIFKKLQAESDAAIEDSKAYADELNLTIHSLGETIDELKQSWYERWFQKGRRAVERKKGS